MHEQRTSLATVMFTDVEGSTDLTTRLGDVAASELLVSHDAVVREQVAAHGGRDVHSTGDGFRVLFDSPRAAVTCALAIERELTAHEHPLLVRIGLNAGEMIDAGGEAFGAAINLAARVMDRAAGGEVLITDTVRQLVGTLPGASFHDRGRPALKGFAERQHLYEVRPDARPPAPPPAPRRRGRRGRLLAGAVLLAAAAAAAAALLGRGPAPIVVPPNAVAVIDPGALSVAAAIPVQEGPGPIAAGAGG